MSCQFLGQPQENSSPSEENIVVSEASLKAQPVVKHTKKTTEPYPDIKSRIRKKQLVLRQKYASAGSDSLKSALRDSCRLFLNTSLHEHIFPHWYGTPWDFNGITEIPGEGVIACGYFVSTTLRDAGFNLNRYRIAQKDATTIIRLLCHPDKTFTNMEKGLAHVKTSPDGLYIVGLDSHVGFLYKTEGQVYFIHASYHDPVEVVKEVASQSSVYAYSEIYVIGDLFSSDKIIERWLLGERVKDAL